MRSLKIVDYFDTPEVLDASITVIPGNASSPLQVIASLAKTSYQLIVADSAQQMVGVYKGASGQEQLECIIGPGVRDVDVSLHRGTRISLRSMTPDPVNYGQLCLQFLGDT